MNEDGKSDHDIRAILTAAKVVALVGASNKPDRPSNRVMRELIDRGYTVHPVNPGLAGQEIHGQMVHARLADIPGTVDLVDVFRNSEDAGAVIDEALALPHKPMAIWLQLGVVNHEGAARAEAAGVPCVMNRCPAIEIPRLGL